MKADIFADAGLFLFSVGQLSNNQLYQLIRQHAETGLELLGHSDLRRRNHSARSAFSGASSPVMMGLPSCQITAYWPNRFFFSRFASRPSEGFPAHAALPWMRSSFGSYS